jgi:hypothetical protein
MGIALSSGDARELNPFHHESEIGAIDLDVAQRAFRLLRKTKRARFEALSQNGKPVAIPEQHLNLMAAPIDENEHVT